MRCLSTLLVSAVVVAAACQSVAEQVRPEEVIALEQAALERWGKGDPDGYLELMAPDLTYFDPTTKSRVDGREAIGHMVAPLRGKITIERAEMIGPRVQHSGGTAILTFNLISRGAQFADGPKSDVHWNSTEVYRRIDGRWRIVHSHWSRTTPVPPQAP